MRFIGPAAVGATLGACAAISGLDQYANVGCTDGCGEAGFEGGVPNEGGATPDAGDDVASATDAPEVLDGTDGGGCGSGLVACDGGCVDERTDNSNCGGCGPAHSCSAGTRCLGGACTAGGSDAGPDACVQVVRPPSVNVDATRWSFTSSPTWNCNAAGTTTIDSNAGTITSTSCPLGTLDFTNNAAQSATGGPTVMVVRLQGLTVTNNHVIKLQGSQPIVLLVAGNVLVDLGGSIDASANGATAGPGGSVPATCSGSTGTASGGSNSGGGGGGFGTAGGYGANSNGSNGAAGGAANASANLQPLRGGCSGGATGGGSGSTAGAGGGAFEISASGTITIGTGSNTAILAASGGFSSGATGVNTGTAGAGSGGGILLVSPVAATFGTGGAARAHGGGSGSGRGVGGNGGAGSNGHTTDNNAAAGGGAPDINGAAGARGGLCAGNNCATASAVGANGVGSQAAGLDGSGGGGGGGRIQVTTATATLVCN